MRFSPDQFWRMSLAEWRAAVDGFAMKQGARRSPPLTRSEFDALMKMHPDEVPPCPMPQ